MGQAGSITAKAMIHPLLRVFTQWEEERINELFLRARGDLSDTFALRFGEFQHLLNRELVSFLLARDIFNDIFDTDRNLIVDKFEVVSVAILMSKLSTQKKVEYLFKLFDFNEKGFITTSESALMFLTVVNAAQKADGRPPKPEQSMLDKLVDTLYGIYTRDPSGKEVLRSDLVSFCANTADVRGYLEFWRGVASQVLLPDGLKWRDPWFPAAQLSITPSCDWLEHGFPPADFVEWRRREHAGIGCTRLFTHTSWTLKNLTATVVYSGPGVVGKGTLKQGYLADRWFLNAVSCAISRPQLLPHLFSFTGQEEEGRFCVRLYEGGGWRTLFVDDRLPCASDGVHLFSSSSDGAEFWVPLLNKTIGKYLKTYGAMGMCGLRPDAPEMALRWLTGGHVMKSASEDYSWKSLSSECVGADGMAHLEAMVREGSIVSLGRSETRILSRDTMEPAPWEGPAHGRLWPVVGFTNEGGYRYVILRDAWGLDNSASKGPPDEDHGHSRHFKVQCEKLSENYDTILTCRFVDSLKDAASTGMYPFPSWRTITMQATSFGPKAPATLKLVVPPGAYKEILMAGSSQKKTRSEFGRELTLAQKYALEKKERERSAKAAQDETELDRLAKFTSPVDLALTVSALQDWGDVGAPRVDLNGQFAAPTIHLRIVPTKATVENIHSALRNEYEITRANEEAERRAKAEKLRVLKEGKNAAAKASADADAAALGSGLEGSMMEDKMGELSVVSGSKATTDSSIVGDESTAVDEKGGTDSLASGSVTAADSKVDPGSEAGSEATAAAAGDKGSKADAKEGEEPAPVPTAPKIDSSADVAPKAPPRRPLAGLDSRQGLVLSPTPHVLEEVTSDTPWAPGGVDPVPDVVLTAQRSWVSHSLTLYPGEYAVYVDVSYNVGAVGKDLTFDMTGELGERPWQESEMSTAEITGAVKPTAEELDARPKKVWTQFSSHFDFEVDVEERESEDFSGDVQEVFVDEERWPFMAESQAEAATRALVERMAVMHAEILAIDTLREEAAGWAKRK